MKDNGPLLIYYSPAVALAKVVLFGMLIFKGVSPRAGRVYVLHPGFKRQRSSIGRAPHS